jgi:hypothetical protein
MFVISAPFWFEPEMRLLGLRDKQREGIEIVTRSKLKECLPATCIPEDLGGKHHVDYLKWIEECMSGYTKFNEFDEGQHGSVDEPVFLGAIPSRGSESDVRSVKENQQSASPDVILQSRPS